MLCVFILGKVCWSAPPATLQRDVFYRAPDSMMVTVGRTEPLAEPSEFLRYDATALLRSACSISGNYGGPRLPRTRVSQAMPVGNNI